MAPEAKMPEMNLGDKLENVANAVMSGGPKTDKGQGQQLASIGDAIKTKEEASGRIEEIQKQLKNLEVRYESSDKEGKRLDKELREKEKAVAQLRQEKTELESKVRQVQPFLDRFANDPSFAKGVEDLVSGKAPRATGVKMEDFGVTDEDFSITEALAKPNSPSGQYYRALRDQDVQAAKAEAVQAAREAVKAELGTFVRQSQAEKAQEIDRVKREAFLKAHPDMTHEDLDALLEKARSVDWGYEDIYAKVNPEKATKRVASGEETLEAIRSGRALNLPGTLAGRGSAGDDSTGQDPSKAVFELIRQNMNPSIMEYAK